MREKVVLKSAKPEEYPNLELNCKVIKNADIGSYLDEISDDKKFEASKNGLVEARLGTPGEVVKTVLLTEVDGKTYILNEEETTVQEREVKLPNGEVVTKPDVVVKNVSSTSDEEYVVKYEKFIKTYEPGLCSYEFYPVKDTRVLTKVSEDVIIETAWGSKALCLNGGYIVTYSKDDNDYNTLEQGAFNSTYEKEETKTKTLR